MNNKIITICIITIIFLIIVIANPTKETVICAPNFVCKISTQYLNLLTFNNYFAINQNSEITFETRPKYGGRGFTKLYDETYVEFDGKRYLKKSLIKGDWFSNNAFQKSQNKKFDDYKLGNVSEYTLSSHIDLLSSPYPSILLLLAISIIILFPNIASKPIF